VIMSVRLSVCLSVTLASHAYTVQDIEILSASYDRGMFIVGKVGTKFCGPESRGSSRTTALHRPVSSNETFF